MFAHLPPPKNLGVHIQKSGAAYHTAGALAQGERIWLVAKLPGQICVVGDDVADKYLLLADSHAGKDSIQVKSISVRVVCQNTLTLALGGTDSFRIIHTPDVKHRLKAAGQLLAQVRIRYDTMEQALQAMARLQVDDSRLQEYLTEVFPDADPTDEAALSRVKRSRQWAGYFFDQGRGNRLPGVTGTLWAAFNSVTEVLDQRKTRRSPHQRLTSLWFGDNYSTKARAFALAEENWRPGAIEPVGPPLWLGFLAELERGIDLGTKSGDGDFSSAQSWLPASGGKIGKVSGPSPPGEGTPAMGDECNHDIVF